MAQHTVEVPLTGDITLDVAIEWSQDQPDYWEHLSAKAQGDDADFLGWFQNDSRAMRCIDAVIERWANERPGTRYGDPMDLARERALED